MPPKSNPAALPSQEVSCIGGFKLTVKLDQKTEAQIREQAAKNHAWFSTMSESGKHSDGNRCYDAKWAAAERQAGIINR